MRRQTANRCGDLTCTEKSLRRLTHRNHSTHTPDACEAALRSARRDEKLQRGARVIEGSLLVRRPSPELTALEDAWWRAYDGGGCDRDQPAFALALYKMYGGAVHRCGHAIRLLAFNGPKAAHEPWSDATAWCHPKAERCPRRQQRRKSAREIREARRVARNLD